MAFVPLEGTRYDMPVVFGPSPVPDRTVVDEGHAIVLTFPTAREAAEKLLPPHFRLPEAVTASLSYVSYRDVDYLGGRSYNEIIFSISAEHEADGEIIAAPFAPILWVNKVGALIAGREFMGLAKLFGTIPDAIASEDEASFSCYEEDALLLKAQASSFRPLSPAALERLNERAGEVRTFGWKYIPAAGRGSDVDYPLLNVMRWDYREGWSGEGWLEWFKPDRIAAPFSTAAMSALSALPVSGPIRAFRGIGSATIDRRATRRLAASHSA